MKKILISILFLFLLFGCKADGMNTIKNSLQKTDDYFKSLSEGTCDDCLLQKADNFFKEVNEGSRKSYNSQNTKTSNIVKVSEKKEEKEISGFWSKTDEFLKKGADLISKKDKITGLRSLNTMSDKKAKKRGLSALNYYVQYAQKNNVKVFKSGDDQYERVKRILDRIILASHFRNEKDLRFEVIDFEDVNALAFGGGNFLVFSGLLNLTTDDELAFVIAHELAHNSASHGAEKEHYMRMKDVFGKKPTNVQRTIFTNIHEQEADRIGLVYTALAGFDPCASVTFARKLPSSLRNYTIFRTHPAPPQRAMANQKACGIIKKYYTKGQVNPNVEKVLKCNELFCNRSSKELKGGEGGGVVAVIEVLADTIQKNKQAKEEQRKQEIEIAQSKAIIAKQRLENPPKVNWQQGQWNVYKGSINRHNQKSGLNFGLNANYRQGQFFYNFNNKIEQGFLDFKSQNQYGYWFSWRDKWGSGLVKLKEYTDGSLRGSIYMNDGTNPGKLMGEFVGYK